MKTLKHYQVSTVPSYFSNISSIQKLAVLHDAPIDDKKVELQIHFNDLYQVFMHRFAQYALTDTVAETEEDKLANIFLQLIKTKRTLREED